MPNKIYLLQKFKKDLFVSEFEYNQHVDEYKMEGLPSQYRTKAEAILAYDLSGSGVPFYFNRKRTYFYVIPPGYLAWMERIR